MKQRFGICNETFAPLNVPDPWFWQRTCAFLGELGYDGVELAPFTFTPDGSSLLRAADDALYASKHAGRNCVHHINQLRHSDGPLMKAD